MDKLRAFYARLLQTNYAYILVLALMGKALISDISISTFLLTVPVLAYEGYKLYLKNKKPDPVKISAEVQRELDQMKSKLNAVTAERSVKQPVQRYF